MTRRLRHRVPAVALLAAGLTAGSWAAAGASTTHQPAVAAPASAPDFEVDPDASVAIGIVLAPTSLDIIGQAGAALDQLLLDNVYETLLRFVDGEVVPGLAASYEISEDGLTYTFTLGEGVTFHNGDPLTAADVAYSLDQSRTDGVGNDAALLADIASVEATDDSTVVVTLSQPNNDFTWNLGRRAGVVVQDGSTADDRLAVANGTGPFVLSEFAEGESITLTRNDAYWGDVPQVGEIVFQFFGGDQNALVNALSDGDIQIAVAVNTELVGPFEDNPDFVISSGPTNGEFTLGLNNAQEALSNPLVRQAITHAIDRHAILDLFNGYGTVIGMPVPPLDPWYEDIDPYPFDPERATELLAEAGYADGLAFDFVYPNHYPLSVADFVVAQLGDVGITVNLEPVDFQGVWLPRVYTDRDYDLTAVLHVEPRDIGNYARVTEDGESGYYWNFNNAEVQDLLGRALRTPDPDEAIELRRQAANLIAAEAPTVMLILYNDLLVASNTVAGFPTDDVNSRFPVAGIVSAG